MTATMSPVIGEATVQELREAMRGEVITAHDDGIRGGVPRSGTARTTGAARR